MATKLSREVGQANPVPGLQRNHNKNRFGQENAASLGNILLYRMGRENIQNRMQFLTQNALRR